MPTFRDYTTSNKQFITFVDSEYYPDYLDGASALYKDVLEKFHELLNISSSSIELLKKITEITSSDRIQLLRIFRKYVSPDTSVEMLKKKKDIESICEEFGDRFRNINEVKSAINARGINDDTLFALLYEYKDRGQKGYELTARFFQWFNENLSDDFKIIGPERAGKDVILSTVLENYNKDTPADFVIFDKNDDVKAVGFARYDTDRGGAQEDDRTGGNKDKITELRNWSKKSGNHSKIIFLNDGPGLLLGSMWEDYCQIEESWPGYSLVCTLKMLDDRLTKEWLDE